MMDKRELADYLKQSAEKKFVESMGDLQAKEALKTTWRPETFLEYCKAVFTSGYVQGYTQNARDATDYIGPYGPPDRR